MTTKEIYQIFLNHPIISTDSRHIKPNCLFIALKGENLDGNDYAKDALNLGASYAIVDNEKYAISDKYILVNNTYDTLKELATIHRNQFNLPVIGITGSNGKTTTKELIASALSKKYNILKTEGNLNNHIGVPQTILRLTKEHDIAVIEMGANHLGEIKELTDIIRPTEGVITNIGPAHLGLFKTINNVIETKKALYEAVKKESGTVFVNEADNLLMDLSKNINRQTYRVGDKPDNISIKNYHPYLEISWENNIIPTNFLGSYNAENIACAIKIATHFQVPKEQIIEAIKSYTPKNNRSELIESNQSFIFLDAYNANPESMKKALTNLFSQKSQQIITILGDMLELGVYSKDFHQEIISIVKAKSPNHAFYVGQQFNQVKDSDHGEYFPSTSDLISHLRAIKPKLSNATILIKGSRGIHLENCLDVVKSLTQ